MRFFSEFIKKQIEFINYFELNHFYFQEVNHFYVTYQICLNLVGMEDKEIRTKNCLFRNFLSNSKNKIDFRTYGKLKDYMKRDINTINLAVEIINEQKEEASYMGDFYFPGSIGVSIHDFN